MWSIWRRRFAQRFKKRELEFRGILTAKVNEAKKFDPATYVKVCCCDVNNVVSTSYIFSYEIIICYNDVMINGN